MVNGSHRPPNKPHIPLTPEMVGALRAEIERNGVRPHALHCRLGSSAPRCDASMYRMLAGKAKTVCPVFYGALLSAWRNLPSRNNDYVKATPEILQELGSLRARTGVGTAKLVKDRADIPAGLTFDIIENFCRGKSSRIRKDYLDYIKALRQSLPSQERVVLTAETRETLRAHIARTGKGPFAILRGARGRPAQLYGATIRLWLSDSATARKDHLDYVLNVYAAAADRVGDRCNLTTAALTHAQPETWNEATKAHGPR